MTGVKLFCFPYAGGSAMVYSGWKGYLSGEIDLRPVELAGRGRRFGEPLYHSMDEMIEDIYQQIVSELDSGPYAFYGHSMGTILAYELVHKIIKHKHQEPVCVFFSGRYPPYCKRKEEQLHLLEDNEFIRKVYELGGTNDELLKNKDLQQLFIPVLKADYKVVETYEHVHDETKFNFNIVILNGKSDDISYEEQMEWNKCTYGKCTIYQFDGGHFFINNNKQPIADIINKNLCHKKQ